MLQIHVIASLIAILVGLFVLYGLISTRLLEFVDRDLPRNDDPDQPDRLSIGAVRL